MKSHSKVENCLLLINGRITHKTYLNWKKVLGFAKKIFNKFDICLTQNKETKRFLKYFNAEKIKDLGNLKFSKAKSFAPIKINKKIKNLLKKNIWCASSTHFNEEELCGKVHIKLKKKIKNLVTIIIPRHVHRTDEIVEKLNHMNLKVQKHSNANKFENNKDIYFVDSYGETLNFYNISKIVFLGGSFIKHGGQNPIEPARLGCKILHGPHIENFKEVYKYLNSVGLSSKTNNIKDLTKYLAYEFKKSSKKNYKYKKQIDYIGQQILNKTFFEIQKYL